MGRHKILHRMVSSIPWI